MGPVRSGRARLQANPSLRPGWYALEAKMTGDALTVASVRLPMSNGGDEDDLVVPLRAVARGRYAAVLRLPHPVEMLRLDIASADPEAEGAPRPAIEAFAVQRLSRASRLAFMARKAWRLARGGDMPLSIAARVMWQRLRSRDPHGFQPVDEGLDRAEAYRLWVAMHDPDEMSETTPMSGEGTSLAVWLVGPPGPERDATHAALDAQTHRPERVVVVEDDVTDDLEGNADVSGLYDVPGTHGIMLLAAGDRPRPHMLAELGHALSQGAVAAYADDDRLDESGERVDPAFKPAYAPLRLRGQNYIGTGLAVRAARLRRTAGLAERLRGLPAGEAAWTFALAATAGLSEAEVRRIPRVLHHTTARTATPPADLLKIHAKADHAAWRAARSRSDGISASYLVASQSLPDTRDAATPRVSLVVPTRDSLDVLRPCIEGLRATAWDDLEILIVDNGSQRPETHAFLAGTARADPRVTVLSRPGPFNYSALNNAAVRAATGAVVGLVNNDIEVVDPGWLAHMVALALEPPHGIVGARLLYPDGTLQHGGVVIGPDGLARHRMTRAAADDLGPHDVLAVPQEVSAVTAACLVMRRAVFEEVGGLDEEAFPVSFNDVDLCLKVRAARYRVIWMPHATLIHHESVSRGSDLTGERAVRARREANALRARWVPFHDPYYNPNLDPARSDYRPRP